MIFNENTQRWAEHHSLTDPKSHWRERFDWCWKTFGHPGIDPDSGAHGGWDYNGGWIYLYQEKNVCMYLLRWP